jgi:putative addiction module killer protein
VILPGLTIANIVFEDGTSPFKKWYRKQTGEAKAEIDVRLEQVKKRNYGDHRRLRKGVIELRIHFGQGLRVYGGEWKGTFFLLAFGGFKNTQQADIQTATDIWVAFTKAQGRK